jgi:hypothetical protein
MSGKAPKINTNVDLNIDNYGLEDLLRLFQLDVDFSEEDLKRAKRAVLATHPDKCKLPIEHYHFFVKAFNLINGMYEFRHKSMRKNPSQTISYDILKDEHALDDVKHNMSRLTANQKFNEEFNRLFEQHRVVDESTMHGYDDWLRSNDGLDEETVVTNEASLHAKIEAKKRNLKAIIAAQEIQELNSSVLGTALGTNAPTSYTSDMGSSLQFEDLKQAYTQSVIPVTQEDYLQRPKYRSVEEFVRDPRYAQIGVVTEAEARQQFARQNLAMAQSSMQRAFNLQRMEEKAKEANAKFVTSFRHLTV